MKFTSASPFLAFAGLSWLAMETTAFTPQYIVSKKTPYPLFMVAEVMKPSGSKPAAGGGAPNEIRASDNFDEDILKDMQFSLQTLERRVKEGPYALAGDEVSDLEAALKRIVRDMNLKLQEPASQTPVPSANDVSHDSSTAVEDVAADVREAATPAEPAPTPEPELPIAKKAEPSAEDITKLQTAVSNMDAKRVTSLLNKGLEMDEETTDAAFWAVVKSVNAAEKQDLPLSGDVATMLHHIFDADHRHLLTREQQRTNITCMQPDDTGMEGAARKMNYIFDDMAHRDLPLAEGRKCEGGHCCDACSRNIFPTFASDAETNMLTFPELASFTFNDLETVSAATILQFVRLIERVRRTISHEYGLPLKLILPLQAYSRKYVAGTTQQGGGGGEGDFVTLHTDEATHDGYHYSCVLYLSTQGKDFEGGDFVFNDPADPNVIQNEEDDEGQVADLSEDGYESLVDEIRRAGRKLTPYHPQRGAAVIFSSGWENMHEVEKITAGTRYAIPCFFTTCPVPEAAYEQMVVGKPQTEEDIADDWLHLLLAHRQETPVQSVGRVKELLMKWHYMCTPLSQH